MFIEDTTRINQTLKTLDKAIVNNTNATLEILDTEVLILENQFKKGLDSLQLEL